MTARADAAHLTDMPAKPKDPYLVAMCPNYQVIATAAARAADSGDQVKAYALHRVADECWDLIGFAVALPGCESFAAADRHVVERSLRLARLIALIRRETPNPGATPSMRSETDEPRAAP